MSASEVFVYPSWEDAANRYAAWVTELEAQVASLRADVAERAKQKSEFFEHIKALEARALKWERLHDSRTEQLNDAFAEIRRLQALNESLAQRVADQSELLTRRAEKK